VYRTPKGWNQIFRACGKEGTICSISLVIIKKELFIFKESISKVRA
jgi:hypothetical protein